MAKKVVLILVDGLRPDAIEKCGHPYLRDLAEKSASCLNARTVMPSVTLPCHASLFFSVPPSRHGILTNTFMPLVRPIDSLGDAFSMSGRTTAMFYNWHQLRDLNRPGSMIMDHCESHADLGTPLPMNDGRIAQCAIDYIAEKRPDFVFLYLGRTDEAGHKYGWMSDEYMGVVADASSLIQRVIESAGEEYTFVVTADHGGHERSHGTEADEDMTIPIIMHGSPFEPGAKIEGMTIIDIATTIASVAGIPAPADWEGRSFAG